DVRNRPKVVARKLVVESKDQAVVLAVYRADHHQDATGRELRVHDLVRVQLWDPDLVARARAREERHEHRPEHALDGAALVEPAGVLENVRDAVRSDDRDLAPDDLVELDLEYAGAVADVEATVRAHQLVRTHPQRLCEARSEIYERQLALVQVEGNGCVVLRR